MSADSVKQQRQRKIVELLAQVEELSLNDLARRLGHVSVVTLRRDVAHLSGRGLVERIRGGVAVLPQGRGSVAEEGVSLGVGEVDAIILPPVGGTGAATLRHWARRRQIPFIAETAAQEGGIYVGHNNFAVGRQLGRHAAEMLERTEKAVDLLMVSSEMLANARARCDGFLRGFAESFHGRLRHWRVDGRDVYRLASQVAREAFAVHRSINVVFGVNDHSILALLDAARESGVKVCAFSMGAEGAGLFNAMMEDTRLKACAALFPELTGMKAIDAIAAIFAGRPPQDPVSVPHAIITRDKLESYYQREEDRWLLRPAVRDALAPELAGHIVPCARRRSIGFVPHFPAHDWYRNMIQAMQARCAQHGFDLRVAPPQASIAEEIRCVRECIARVAAAKVRDGDTIAINAGEISLCMAAHLDEAASITIVTNSLDILERLSGRGRFKVILTSGEYRAAGRCLVGPSLGALFETLRVDKTFLSVDGLSARFGPSCLDERMALAARRLCAAAREVHVMADHSLFGAVANHRIAPLGEITGVIADHGTLSSDRLALMAAGLQLTLADAAPNPIHPTEKAAHV